MLHGRRQLRYTCRLTNSQRHDVAALSFASGSIFFWPLSRDLTRLQQRLSPIRMMVMKMAKKFMYRKTLRHAKLVKDSVKGTCAARFPIASWFPLLWSRPFGRCVSKAMMSVGDSDAVSNVVSSLERLPDELLVLVSGDDTVAVTGRSGVWGNTSRMSLVCVSAALRVATMDAVAVSSRSARIRSVFDVVIVSVFVLWMTCSSVSVSACVAVRGAFCVMVRVWVSAKGALIVGVPSITAVTSCDSDADDVRERCGVMDLSVSVIAAVSVKDSFKDRLADAFVLKVTAWVRVNALVAEASTVAETEGLLLGEGKSDFVTLRARVDVSETINSSEIDTDCSGDFDMVTSSESVAESVTSGSRVKDGISETVFDTSRLDVSLTDLVDS